MIIARRKTPGEKVAPAALYSIHMYDLPGRGQVKTTTTHHCFVMYNPWRVDQSSPADTQAALNLFVCQSVTASQQCFSLTPIQHQPPATSQPVIFFSHNKSASTISQSNEAYSLGRGSTCARHVLYAPGATCNFHSRPNTSIFFSFFKNANLYERRVARTGARLAENSLRPATPFGAREKVAGRAHGSAATICACVAVKQW
jgi:hypothetical protein